ncbi:hypothetical protein Hanom_Chr06g00493041 [Helianthus anomalus]
MGISNLKSAGTKKQYASKRRFTTIRCMDMTMHVKSNLPCTGYSSL